MRRRIFAAPATAVFSLALAIPDTALARSNRQATGTHARSSTHASNRRSADSKRRAVGVKRDAVGRIARSGSVKREFQREHPCPSTGKLSGRCPGYAMDHVKVLKRGGIDDPSNLQWQTRSAAKAKDRWE